MARFKAKVKVAKVDLNGLRAQLFAATSLLGLALLGLSLLIRP